MRAILEFFYVKEGGITALRLGLLVYPLRGLQYGEDHRIESNEMPRVGRRFFFLK